MNRKQKFVLVTTLVLVTAALVAWLVTGHAVYSKRQVPVETIDPLFGTKTIVWKDAIVIGLDVVAPVVLLALALGTIFFVLFRTRPSGDTTRSGSENERTRQ